VHEEAFWSLHGESSQEKDEQSDRGPGRESATQAEGEHARVANARWAPAAERQGVKLAAGACDDRLAPKPALQIKRQLAS
jgi:hypothetical protein